MSEVKKKTGRAIARAKLWIQEDNQTCSTCCNFTKGCDFAGWATWYELVWRWFPHLKSWHAQLEAAWKLNPQVLLTKSEPFMSMWVELCWIWFNCLNIYLEPSPTQIDSDRSKACLGLQLQLQSAMADRGWDHAAWQQYRSTSRHMRLTADVNCSPAASGELRGKVWPIQGWNLDIAAVGNIELWQACRLQAILVVCNDWGKLTTIHTHQGLQKVPWAEFKIAIP
jgi:hypothetical protein